MCHILRIKIKSIVKEMQTKLGGGGGIYIGHASWLIRFIPNIVVKGK